MATLEKIRSKGPLLVAIIGIALVAFIIGDFLNSGMTFFNKSKETVAEIAGENISIFEYQNAIDQMTEVIKIERNQNDLGEELTSQIRAQVWETLVGEKLMLAEAEKIGLTVSKEELSDRLIGNNIHPIIMQRSLFYDQTGRFNRSQLINFLNSLDVDPGNNADFAQQINQAKNYWLYWENVVKNDILQEKYNTLLAKSVTANNIDAKANFDARLITADFEYVAQPYYMVADSVVSVSDSEIKNRYSKNKEIYKQDDSRSFSYVVFTLKPQEDDYVQVQEWMDRVSREFETTDDVVGFISTNSDVPYSGFDYSEKNIPLLLKDFAFSSHTGDIFGPVFQNDTHTMARIMETGIMRADSVKLRHIYLYPNEDARADSILNVLQRNGGSNFAELAGQFSAIPETAANGGEIGWLVDGMKGIDKEFMWSFDKKVNEVYSFKNANGIQIVQVMEKTQPVRKVKVAILERKVTPSSRTQANIYNDAKQFAASVKNIEEFNAQAEQYNVVPRPAYNINSSTERVANIPQSRQVVRWVFNSKSKVGSVSDVFDLGDQFVVAVVTEINEKGYMPLEKVSSQIKAEITKEKKADYIIENLNKTLASNNSISALANTLNVEVLEAANISFNSYQFGTSGFEPYVIGKALNQDLNKVSAPVKGNSGVYVVLKTDQRDNTASNTFNTTAEINQLNSRNMQSLPYVIYENIRKNANIVDNRINFY